MELLPYFSSFICALIAIAITIAFICSTNFRTDLISGEGKAKLFGFINIEGVIITILYGVLIGGMIYALPDDTKNKIKSLENVLANKKTELAIALENNKSISPPKVIKFIKNLDPSSEISDEIRKIQKSNKGPWNHFSKSKAVTISVPGAKAENKVYKKIVYGCGEYFNKKLQIISDYKESKGETIKVTVNGVINNASNCNELSGGVDIQLDCDSGNKLFTDKVLSCDSMGNPLWSERVRNDIKKFPAYAVVIVNEKKLTNSYNRQFKAAFILPAQNHVTLNRH